MNRYPFIALSCLLALSSWSLWTRYRQGRLLTPASGLHLQILIFFGIGGFAFLMFQDVEPKLASADVTRFTAICCWPLVIGYSVAVILENYWFRLKTQEELVLLRGYKLPTDILFILTFLGDAGYFLDGRLKMHGLEAIPAYLKELFFPCLLLSIIYGLSKTDSRRSFAVFQFLIALTIAIISPWRSVMVYVGAAIWLAILLTRPRWIAWVSILGLFALLYVIPMQNLKKANYEQFQMNPWSLVQEGLDLSMSEDRKS